MARTLPRPKNGPSMAALSLAAALVTNCGEPPPPSFTETLYRPGQGTQNAERLDADAVADPKVKAEFERNAQDSDLEDEPSDNRGYKRDSITGGPFGDSVNQGQSDASAVASGNRSAGNPALPQNPAGPVPDTAPAAGAVEDGAAGTESAPTWARNQPSPQPGSPPQNAPEVSPSPAPQAPTAQTPTAQPIGGSNQGDQGIPSTPAPAMITQNLIQPPKRPVDLLWIVDTSASMEEEQKYLASNFQSFITAIKSSGINFQTALTSTDVCDPSGAFNKYCPVDYGGSAKTHLQGSFVGTSGRKILKDSDSDLISKFTTYANMGISGSGFEHGLTAAAMAVAKSLSGQNETFVRSNAFLSIIVVSDEEDDGIGLSQADENGYNFADLDLSSYRYTHNDFISELNKIKGAGNFAVTAITGTKNADGKLCTSPHSKPYEEGSQYINAAKATGGLVQSICETNWSKSLTNIGQDLTAQISQISLEKSPNPDSITVEINGAITKDWQYIAATNAIKFSPSAIPIPGASIKVSYQAAP